MFLQPRLLDTVLGEASAAVPIDAEHEAVLEGAELEPQEVPWMPLEFDVNVLAAGLTAGEFSEVRGRFSLHFPFRLARLRAGVVADEDPDDVVLVLHQVGQPAMLLAAD